MQPNPRQPDTKNFIFAIVSSLLILFLYQTFWAAPREKARQAQLQQVATTQQAQQAAPQDAATQTNMGKIVSREEALALSSRNKIQNSLLSGSVSSFGARIDDLNLLAYREKVNNPKNVTLLNPQGSKDGYFAFFGYSSNDGVNLPGPNSVWKLVSGNVLAPNAPLVYEFDNGQGLKITRKLDVDNEYLFTYTDTITNSGAAPINLQAYGAIRRYSKPVKPSSSTNHEGTIGIFNNTMGRLKYREMEKGKALNEDSKGGWLGIVDEYWLVALIPSQDANIQTTQKATPTDDGHMYEASFVGAQSTIGAGQSITNVERVYAGSKKVSELRAYEQRLNIPKFDNAIDWGVLWFLSKPFYWLLMFFNQHIGNIGLAILALTVVVKVATFPLVYQSYKSFAKMRELTPKMNEIKEKFKDDTQKQQQETLKLYQTEKINPVAGCVPMLLTMPIFLALFKILSVTLELRHTPFYGWIPDLSAKDPTNFMNLFGLLPYDPSIIPVIGAMGIGIWPILYGASMWLMQKMQPTPTSDPMQNQIMMMMPWFFAFIFGGFASGLVIYYTWSNLLTIVQQYIIAKQTGSPTVFDEWFKKQAAKKAAK
jgi:YidC/Oxa1 family membrane protein insertase